MLKFVEFEVGEGKTKVKVTGAHVDRETKKIFFMQWQKNRSPKRKLMKSEVNKIMQATSYGHFFGPPKYHCFCEVDKVSYVLMLMEQKARELIINKLAEWEKRIYGLNDWRDNPTYSFGITKRGDAPNLQEVDCSTGTD